MRGYEGGTVMFEKTREVVRKDRYGFPEEEFPHRAIMIGSPHASLSRKELSLMAGFDPLLAGDVRDNPAYDSSKPPSQENFLFAVTVTADLLGGTRNLVSDGGVLFLVHGERKYRLGDEGLIRKRSVQLGIKVHELAKAFEGLERRVLQAVSEIRSKRARPSEHAISR
jgi:hypothetical protein